MVIHNLNSTSIIMTMMTDDSKPHWLDGSHEYKPKLSQTGILFLALLFNNDNSVSGWWFGTFFIFPYIGLLIIPIDFHIFQRGGPTTNQV